MTHQEKVSLCNMIQVMIEHSSEYTSQEIDDMAYINGMLAVKDMVEAFPVSDIMMIPYKRGDEKWREE